MVCYKTCSIWQGCLCSIYRLAILILLILPLSCKHFPLSPKINPANENIVPKFVTELSDRMWANYANNPDSAEIKCYRIIQLCDSLNLPATKLYTYAALAELYQYRKPDLVKGSHCLTQAMKVFTEIPDEIYLKDPFLFIDLGNLFFKFEYYPQSRIFYRLAFKVAKNLSYHPRQLSLLNIALSFQKENRNDSALFYFELSDRHIIDRKNFLLAQNYNYKAEFLMQLCRYDSILPMLNRGLKIEIGYGVLARDTIKNNKMLFISMNETMGKTHELLFRYYGRLDQIDSSLFHYNQALFHANQVQSETARARLYLYKVLMNNTISYNGSKSLYADSVICLVSKNNDLELLRDYSDSLETYFNKLKVRVLSNKYGQISNEIAERLYKLKTTGEMNENALFLASIAAEHAFLKSEGEGRIKTGQIEGKNVLILGISLISLVGLFLLLIRRGKLPLTTTPIPVPAVHEDEKILENHASDEKTRVLMHKLEAVMEEQRPYINPDFTVNDLSDLLQSNVTYTSQMINQEYGLNFNEFVNQYRVKFASTLLSCCENDHSSFIQIAEKSGFRSKSTFYRAFNKFMGMSPVEFQKAADKTREN